MTSTHRTAFRIAGIYGLIGLVWLALSNQAASQLPEIFADPAPQQIAKGSLFVVVTTVLFYLLVYHLVSRNLKQRNDRERQFRKQLDALPHIVWHTDASGQLINISGAYSRLTGISLANASPSDWINALHPNERAEILDTWAHALGRGKTYTSEFRMRMVNGTYRFFESQGTPIFDQDGVIIQWIGTIIDIHERKQAELALAEKEANLRLAVEGANIGFWDWNIGAGTIDYSDQWKKQVGLDGCQLPRTLGFFQRLIHADDFTAVIALKERIESNPKGSYCIEYRLAHSDGSYRWMLSPATIIRDDNGEIVRLLGANIDITDRKEAEQQLEYQAMHDELLGLPNRRKMKHILNKLIDVNANRVGGAGVIAIDLDDFKALNDSIDHGTGDEVLRAVAERINNCLGDNDLLCRPDGDEFVVIVRGDVGREAVLLLAHRIQRVFDDAFHIGNHRLFFTATLGISLYPDHGQESELLLRYADAALHRGKHSGKNCIQLFDPGIASELQEWSHLKNALQAALSRNELSVVFQPQVDVDRGHIIGFEALARWFSPTLGQVAPDRFIPIAENSGIIDIIGEFVLAKALAFVASWSEERRRTTRVAVNISARQLLRSGFAAHIKQMVRAANIPNRCIELEITETSIMQNFDMAASVLNELTEAGFSLAIDDFGTGYCNLSYLKRLQVNTLKIDRSFIQDMTADNSDGQIVEAIIALAHKLGMSVIAEGVETHRHLAFLKTLQCETGQGYYFSKPLLSEDANLLMNPRASNVTAISKIKG